MFRLPAATGWLIATNVVVHIVRTLLPTAQDAVVEDFLAFHTSCLHGDFGILDAISLITYQFLHGGWDHLGANMVFLLAMGPGVERPIGKLRYLAIYFISGVVGALVEGIFTPSNGDDLLVGASASISGIFGALVVIWRLYRLGDKPLGLVRMAGLLIATMAITGILGLGAPEGTPVGWIAHIGGFIAGMGLGFAFRPRLPER
jgi:membrane associated rhomboid family serine protease